LVGRSPSERLVLLAGQRWEHVTSHARDHDARPAGSDDPTELLDGDRGTDKVDRDHRVLGCLHR
jgi:hypothetical protein